MGTEPARRSDISPFLVMEVLRRAGERAAAGGDVLHLEIGQPSTGAPRGAIEAAHRALDADPLGYTDAPGFPSLRRRIAALYRERYGVDLDPGRVAVTTGSSAGFLLAFAACFDPGDRVLLTDPSYPCYRNILHVLGIEPVGVPVGPESRFQPTPETLDRAGDACGHDVKGLIVASPSNPTGSMLAPDELERLAEACAERGIRLISDEIYHGLTFGRPEATAVDMAGEPIVVNSFSKYWSMTGWRIGWLVLPERLTTVVERLAQNLFISPPALAQHAALAAMDCREELEANREVYAANRALMLERLPRVGFRNLSPPDGGFYIWAHIGHLTDDSSDFCRRLLDETGVAITPGADFDPRRGSEWVRFSFAIATADVEAALGRLGTWLGH